MLHSVLVVPMNAPHRFVVAAAAAVAAIAHIPVIAPHLEEAPYMGVAFVIFTVACLASGAAVLAWDAPVAYVAAAGTCALAILGYSATRFIAFPMLADDVGNWLEPLGVLSVAAESVVVVAAAIALLTRAVPVPVGDRKAPASAATDAVVAGSSNG
mgnify:FL=1